ncbi:hypothetical protein P3T75_01085 [Enterococcus montenegrensis]|nr:hypothetical protein [Enterococcus montenegrensis]WHA09467.1 hypothetical protein P3T75_01085 [Enterococcus montenegrensis]
MFGKKKKDDLLAELEELGFQSDGDDEVVSELEAKNTALSKEIEALKVKNEIIEKEKLTLTNEKEKLQTTIENMENELASVQAIPAD